MRYAVRFQACYRYSPISWLPMQLRTGTEENTFSHSTECESQRLHTRGRRDGTVQSVNAKKGSAMHAAVVID